MSLRMKSLKEQTFFISDPCPPDFVTNDFDVKIDFWS